MKIKCLGSGSSGNCYLLTADNGETLILDAGIGLKEIKRGLDYDLRRISGVVVTHSHLDHAKSVADFERMGISVFKPHDETKACPLKIKYGNFDIQAFKLPHNGTPNYGYYIKIDGQRILYLTDFEYCPYVFVKQKINHFLIECNYQQELVDRDLPNYEHKIRGHCSLDTCKEFIKVNATDSLQTVLLCHLGVETTEPKECVAEVQKIVPSANVEVARAGLVVSLRNMDECPF